MNCLKCGREISDEETFCMDCLLEAQKYPVNPAAAVYLPRRETVDVPKKPAKRRVLFSEEQTRLLQRRVRIQCVLLILLFALVAAMAYPTYRFATSTTRRPGQNYSSVTMPTVPGPDQG